MEMCIRDSYGTVAEFLELTEDEWFQMLTEGCRKIGRNLNDTRGLFHSFRDSYEAVSYTHLLFQFNFFSPHNYRLFIIVRLFVCPK